LYNEYIHKQRDAVSAMERELASLEASDPPAAK
jgi:hypothetical protein